MKEFIEAIVKGDLSTVKKLCEENAQLADTRDHTGMSPFMIALYSGQQEIADFLLSQDISFDSFEAASAGQLDTLKEMLTENPDLMDAFSSDGFSHLHLAAVFGQADVVAYLLTIGCDPNVVSKNPMKLQPLHSATVRAHFEVVQHLVKAGADVNAKQEGGFVPLHAAAAIGSLEIIEFLLENGADVHSESDDGKTAISLALEKGHAHVTEVLKKHADKNTS